MTTEKEYKTFCDLRAKLTTSLSKVEIIKGAKRTKDIIAEEIRQTMQLFDKPPKNIDININKLPNTLDDLAKILVQLRRKWLEQEKKRI